MPPSVDLVPADSGDLDRIERLLAANDLPHEDVRGSPADFYLAWADESLVGIGGLEPYGSNALLRSVVVREGFRGEGYGNALCAALERAARSQGIETLYLLTATAAGFFRDRGFEAVDRATVPRAIRETAEFSDLCPATATCLRTELD